jgi:hypothetical protein
MVESPLDPAMPDGKTYKLLIQLEDSLSKTVPFSTEEPSKGAGVGNNLDPKYEITLVKFL